MRYVLKLAFEFLVVMLKITGYSFGLLFLVLGEVCANSEPSKTKYWCGESDDGYDLFGSPMTPGDEGMGLVSRNRFL